jgi:murein L,D-transpeptidase YcbB/YkuD
VLIVAATLGVAPSPVSSQDAATVQEALSSHLNSPRSEWTISPELRFEDELRHFYRARAYAPLWLSPTGRDGRLDELIAALRSADRDGLRSEDYGVAEWSWLHADPVGMSPSGVVEVELRLSDALLTLAHDLSRGRVDPRELPGEWSSEREPFDAGPILEIAAGGRGIAIAQALSDLRPLHPQYHALREALSVLRDVDDWVHLPDGETLRAGDSGVRVGVLRRRLAQSGDLSADGATAVDSTFFDAVLERAVERFQGRHGLPVDGLVGEETLRELNVPAQDRARQVAVNMERWRWLPDDLGDRRVIVNVPDFSATVEEAGSAPVRLRAIVGRTERETPTFSSRIESFSLAPYWNVPENLARKDILPNIREDTLYLDRMRMTAIDLETGELVDGDSIDWAGTSDDEFLARYRLRQEPGPANSLGNVRLAFPNPYTVFLHDTPSQSLFDDSQRAFSSGCVRVEKPLELLDWLLDGDPRWGPDRITEVLEAGEETVSLLREPVPIHLVYMTALVDEEGRLGFRPDVYGLDWVLQQALESAAVVEERIAEAEAETCGY